MKPAMTSFDLTADNMGLIKLFLLRLLKQQKYKVEQTSMGDTLSITASSGNKLVHYVAEQVLDHLPLSEFLDWAIRLEVTLQVKATDNPKQFKLLMGVSALSNEINPIAQQLERFEETSIAEQTAESNKCRKAFRALSKEIIASKFAA